MPLNYLYAARTYVDEWIACDRQSRKVLGFREGYAPASDEAYEQLVEVATRYSVIRNFRVESEHGDARLSPVWKALQEIEAPVSDQDAKDCVEKLVVALKGIYGRELVSAASKFLWMRFGSPIIIYDSLTWNWMCKQGCSTIGNYDDFYEAWRKNFEDEQREIGAACEELLSVRKFFCPSEVTNEEFEQAVSSRWFAERVFDHAIVNESSRIVRQGNRPIEIRSMSDEL